MQPANKPTLKKLLLIPLFFLTQCSTTTSMTRQEISQDLSTENMATIHKGYTDILSESGIEQKSICDKDGNYILGYKIEDGRVGMTVCSHKQEIGTYVYSAKDAEAIKKVLADLQSGKTKIDFSKYESKAIENPTNLSPKFIDFLSEYNNENCEPVIQKCVEKLISNTGATKGNAKKIKESAKKSGITAKELKGERTKAFKQYYNINLTKFELSKIIDRHNRVKTRR